MAPDGISTRLRAQAGDALWAVGVLREAGVLRPMRPDKLLRVGERFVRLGTSPALGSAATAITHPDDTAIIDEIGTLSFAATHARSNALARALADNGVGSGDGVQPIDLVRILADREGGLGTETVHAHGLSPGLIIEKVS